MLTAVLTAPGVIALIEEPVPAAGANELLLRVESVGLCGSDLTAFKGKHPLRRPPVVLGHEASGVVAGVGSAVTGFAVGDRVAVCPQVSCGTCDACSRGLENVCTQRKAPGIGSWPGFLSETIAVPAATAVRLDASIPADMGCLTETLAVAVHAVERARLLPSASAAVIGGGTVGVLCAVVACRRGASVALVIDPKSTNRSIAESFAGVRACRSDLKAIREATTELTRDKGFDVVLVASGHPSSLDEAHRLVCRGGRIVVAALYGAAVTFDPLPLVAKEVDIAGTATYTQADFSEAAAMLAEHWAALRRVITHHGRLSDVQRYLDDMGRIDFPGMKIVIEPQHG